MTFEITVPLAQYEYISWLAKNTALGTRETEVASFILTTAVRKMIKDKEHERAFPREPVVGEVSEADANLPDEDPHPV